MICNASWKIRDMPCADRTTLKPESIVRSDFEHRRQPPPTRDPEMCCDDPRQLKAHDLPCPMH